MCFTVPFVAFRMDTWGYVPYFSKATKELEVYLKSSPGWGCLWASFWPLTTFLSCLHVFGVLHGKVALETTQWDLLTKEQAHRYLRAEDFSILKFFAVRCGLRATSAFLLQLFWKHVIV
jgi:hypothetical protein